MIPNTIEIQQYDLISFVAVSTSKQLSVQANSCQHKQTTTSNNNLYLVARVSTLRALLIHTSNEIVGKQTDLARDPRSLASIRHLLIEQQFFPRKDIKSLSGGYQNLQLK